MTRTGICTSRSTPGCWAAGGWRGLHSVGVRDMIEAINGIGHAAVATDPEFRTALADAGFTMDPETGEIDELGPFVGAFSARTAQIRGNVDRYEATWRVDHPGEEPGPRLREAWDRRAWAEARPDKVVPKDDAAVVERWNEELRALGYSDPAGPVPLVSPRIADIDRDAAVDLVLSRLGAKRSAWNAADIRGQVELLIAQTGLTTAAGVRTELAEDLTARAVTRCTPLLLRPDAPEHVRSLTSPAVLTVETAILERLLRRSQTLKPARLHRASAAQLTPEQARAVAALTGGCPLVVVEGAAGAGKTTTLARARTNLAMRGHRLLVLTPTLKAAEVAARETGAEGHSAAWLIHQHGWRWDNDGRWTRQPSQPAHEARLQRGDLLLVDEAGMVDQDTALALLTIADEAGARIAFMGDRHQLPAVGRGGVLDHAVAWAHPSAVLTLDEVHRFADPDYATLSLQMRDGRQPDAVFDRLLARGQVLVQTSWRAHYRTPSGAQRNKTFSRKIDAERFLAGVESAKVVGTYVDPALAKVTVGEWAQRWLDGQAHLKPTTHARYAGILRKHIHPRWDRVKLANVSHGDVQAWVTELARDQLPRHRPEDPSGAQPGPRHGRQGRSARAQRRDRSQPAARPEARAAATSPTSRSTTSPRRPATRRTRASFSGLETAPTRPTASWCCSSPTPASGSARWPRSASRRLDLRRNRARHRRVRHPGSGPGARLGDHQDPPATRGADPTVPRRRAGRAHRGQAAR